MPFLYAYMGLKTIDFLDLRSDLINNTYQSYRKSKTETVYVNKHSNTLKELPKAINKQITNI